jgi:polyisoprenyl-teichoic acid--peptidoglycan teichoic acid transferase
MSHADDKPYTRYRAARIRRPRTDAPARPSSAPPKPPAASSRGRDAADRERAGGANRERAGGANRERGGGGAGGGGASARATRPHGEPPSVYRTDRRGHSRPDQGGVPVAARTARRRRRFRWWYLLALPLALVVAFGVWAFLGYSTFDKAVARSNRHVTKTTRAALADSHGGLLGTPTTLLVLGSDQRGHEPARSDSILLMRFDPRTHTVSQLSIPRDTLVTVPGRGQMKINAAYFWGGPALAVKVVSSFTGVPINHVVLVNFHGFPALIDSVGGVEIDVPADLTSWYTGNTTVHFKKGPQLMTGKRALIYSRVRHSDNDFMRMGRQQQVVQALEKKIARRGNLFHLPAIGARAMKDIGTDLSTNQLIELAYLEWRAKSDHQFKAVLQGTPEMIGGGDYVVVSQTVLRRTIAKFLSR